MGGKTTTHAMIDRIMKKKKATSASETFFFKFLVAVLRRCSLFFFSFSFPSHYAATVRDPLHEHGVDRATSS